MDEVRGIPLYRTTDEPRTPEQEELFKRMILSMREEGKRDKVKHEFNIKEEEQ